MTPATGVSSAKAAGTRASMETISRNGDIRPNIYFAVSKGTAKEFLESVNPKTEVNPVRYYTMIFENDYSGFIPQNMSQDFYLFSGSEEKSTVMPICSASSKKETGDYSESGYQYEVEDYVAGDIPTDSKEIQIAGTAVFNRDKKVAEIGEIDTEIFNILTGEYQSSVVTYYFDEGTPVTVMQMQKKRPKISVETDGERAKIKVTLYLEAEISSGTGNIESKLGAFSETAADEIKKEAAELFEQTKAVGTDIVGFGSFAKRNFKSIEDFQRYNWKEQYKNAEMEIKVQFSIRRTGLIVRS